MHLSRYKVLHKVTVAMAPVFKRLEEEQQIIPLVFNVSIINCYGNFLDGQVKHQKYPLQPVCWGNRLKRDNQVTVLYCVFLWPVSPFMTLFVKYKKDCSSGMKRSMWSAAILFESYWMMCLVYHCTVKWSITLLVILLPFISDLCFCLQWYIDLVMIKKWNK